ncbi:MAG: DUF2911 domain-containing protein [Planctomycetes bacterium]|nr:DUF2911 domain-containing protein [Planctomycetota bacterium]
MTIRPKTVLLIGLTVSMTLIAARADDADLSVLRETSVHRIGTTTITLSSPKMAAFTNWEESTAESASIGFDKDIRMNGNWVAAGSYSLRLQRVAENDLHVVLNLSVSTGTTRDAKRSGEVLRLAVRPVEAPAADSPSLGIKILREEEEEEEDRDENEEDEAEEEEEDGEEEEQEEEDYEEENRFAELYFHWGTRRAAVRLVMTGMRRRATPAPEMPRRVREPWSVVLSSLEALVAEDLEKHIEDFAEDFESGFDDGGSALAHAQLLGHFRRGGGLEGVLLNLDQVTWTADERSAEFRNIVIFTAEDRLVFAYRLAKTDKGWKTVYLTTE